MHNKRSFSDPGGESRQLAGTLASTDCRGLLLTHCARLGGGAGRPSLSPGEGTVHRELTAAAGACTFGTLCVAGQVSPQGRSPRCRLERTSSLGRGSSGHSECILLCWALRGAEKKQVSRPRPSTSRGCCRACRPGRCAEAPRPPVQLDSPGAHWASAFGCPHPLLGRGAPLPRRTERDVEAGATLGTLPSAPAMSVALTPKAAFHDSPGPASAAARGRPSADTLRVTHARQEQTLGCEAAHFKTPAMCGNNSVLGIP